ERGAHATLSAAPHADAALDGGIELVLPTVPIPGAAPAAARRAAGVRPARDPAKRDPPRDRGWTGRHFRVSRAPPLGRALAGCPGDDGLRLDRRARELPARRGLPRPGLHTLVARGSARDRQGHHALPLHLLAGHADERGARTAARRLGARVPDLR